MSYRSSVGRCSSHSPTIAYGFSKNDTWIAASQGQGQGQGQGHAPQNGLSTVRKTKMLDYRNI